jgi:glycosyltransferase involved in cell wall biosynthesis
MRYKQTVPALLDDLKSLTDNVSQFDGVDVDGLTRELKRHVTDAAGAIIYNWEPSSGFVQALREVGYRGHVVVRIDTVLPERARVRIQRERQDDRVIFVAVSDAARTRFLDLGGKSCLLIRNSPDLDRFRPRIASVRDRSEPLHVGFIGRLATDKDHEILIRAVGRCSGPIALKIAGAGPLHKKLESLADEVAPGRIQFLGAVPHSQIHGFLASLDLYVQASLPIEGSSNALLEAIATGLPIISTSSPAHLEIETGALFVESENDLVVALDMMQSDQARDEYAGRSLHARRQFDVDRMVKSYVDLFF